MIDLKYYQFSRKLHNKDTKKYYKRFIMFLSKHNCLDRYFFSLNNRDLIWFFKNQPPSTYISSAFVWKSTHEGREFWKDLHNLWLKERLK